MMAFLIVLASYLIGSIHFGLVGGVFFKIRDPRTFGSKNIGATNILRSGNKKAAAFTLFFDMFKGFLAVLIASYIDKDIVYLVILSVVFGHIFPIYLLFKGGKGVATFMGALLSYSAVVGSLTLLTWTRQFTKNSQLEYLPSRYRTFSFFFLRRYINKISVLLLSIFIFFKHSKTLSVF